MENEGAEEIIEIEDDDDDDDDDDELLHLRLLALESATKNVTAKEEKENQSAKQSLSERSSSYSGITQDIFGKFPKSWRQCILKRYHRFA